jgi:hypothetical protein
LGYWTVLRGAGWGCTTSTSLPTVRTGLVVSTTVMVTVCCAVAPNELVTALVMLVAPSGKTYVARSTGALVAAR